jgi:hypothetical protein
MVSEDGVRQDVRFLRLVAGSEVRVEDERQAAETQQAGRTAAPVNPLRTVNLVCIILSDLTPETRATAFSAARRFVEQELRSNTSIGVLSLDLRGVRPVFPFFE